MTDRDYRRERVLDEALASGKIAESRRQHYRDAWEGDPNGTERLLASLEGVPILATISEARPRVQLAAHELFPELRNPRPLRYGGSPTRASAPTRPVRRLAPPSPPAHQRQDNVALTPEVVAAWSAQLFPEAAARHANGTTQVMHAND